VSVDVGKTILGMDALGARIHNATRTITDKGAHLIQAASRSYAPIGTPGNSTNAPGDLARSIIVDGPFKTGTGYTASIGPTVIYGRQRALGGYLVPKVAPAMAFSIYGQTFVRTLVYQKDQPFMHPGRDTAVPAILSMAKAQVTIAIKGG
jgi:hypothetical protein